MFAEFPGYHQGGTFPPDVRMVRCAPSFQQFFPSIYKDEEEQLTPFRNRAPTVNQFDVCRMARCAPSFQQLIGFFSVSNNSVNARSTVKQKQ
jgi:hypothetical protein